MKQNSRRSPSRIRDGGRGKPVPDGPLDVRIERLGDGGDGIAETACGRLYIPLSLPGERVRVQPLRPRGDGFVARVVDVLVPDGARQPPPCPHFGVCGGCALQHLADDAYAGWKTARLMAALARAGLDGAADVVAPLVRTPPGSRRRATFAASRGGAGGAVRLGFQVREGHEVVDLTACLVVDPMIVALLPPLRRLLSEALPAGGRALATVTLLDGGLDVLLTGMAPRSLTDHERLARFAEAADLARLSWRQDANAAVEPLLTRRPTCAIFDGVAVAVPPAGFLQPSLAGEAALRAAVVDGIAGATVVADLFCGSGTFALPLLQRGVRVHAIDADAGALAALSAAGSRLAAAARLDCERRDLFTRPLAAAELAHFAAVVLDPPRAGARAQVAALADCEVPVVVYVSCNPATFARDARLLENGGYRLERVTPVDQFLWSPHLELVAAFRRRAEK